MARWEKLWESFAAGHLEEEQDNAFPSPYIRGKAKSSGNGAEALMKLVNTGTNIVDIDPPRTKAEVDDVLEELMAVFDDMFEIVQGLQGQQMGEASAQDMGSAWSGSPKQHPYSGNVSELSQEALGDLNGAVSAVSVMITSSPGHPVNTKLKQVETKLKQVYKELADVMKDIRPAPAPGSRPPGVPGA